jgi:hypothetical protein
MKRPIKTIRVKPATKNGKVLRVPCPVRTGQRPRILPPDGAEVQCINSGEVRFWNRRILDGDVKKLGKSAKVGKPIPAAPKQGAGSSPRFQTKPEGGAKG